MMLLDTVAVQMLDLKCYSQYSAHFRDACGMVERKIKVIYIAHAHEKEAEIRECRMHKSTRL